MSGSDESVKQVVEKLCSSPVPLGIDLKGPQHVIQCVNVGQRWKVGSYDYIVVSVNYLHSMVRLELVG